MNFRKLGLFLVVATVALFSACSDDDDDKGPSIDYAQEIQGVYKSQVAVTIPDATIPETSTRKISITRVGENKVKLELAEFSFGGIKLPKPIQLSEIEIVGSETEVKFKEATEKLGIELGTLPIEATVALVEGVIKDKEINLILNITDALPGTIKVTIEGDKLAGDESQEAKITALSFNSEMILQQPIIAEGTEFLVYLKDEAVEADLKEIEVLVEVSEKATVSPVNGTKVDLSKGSVVFIVTAEDGTEVEYTVKTSKASMDYFDMEEWIAVNPKDPENLIYYKPAQGTWSSSNNGLAIVAGLGIIPNFKYPLTKTEDAYEGTAARIETLMTEVSPEYIDWQKMVPMITAGSLYTGTFSAMSALQNPLSATRFGIPFSKNPLYFTFCYKYEPGETYYESSAEAKDVIKPVEGKKDACTINAILYEIEKDTDSYITGVDTYSDERIVAEALFSSNEKVAKYVKETIAFKLKDGKNYSKDKKYRIAIIASSSSDGGTFSGAPGSTLYLDNVGIISEEIE